jgi:hypothetical protein
MLDQTAASAASNSKPTEMQDTVNPNQLILPGFPHGVFYVNYHDGITESKVRSLMRKPRSLTCWSIRPQTLASRQLAPGQISGAIHPRAGAPKGSATKRSALKAARLRQPRASPGPAM